MATKAFNHIAMNCRDVAAQERFYTKHFGFKRSRTFHAGLPTEFVMLKLGVMRLELHPTESLKVAGCNAGEQSIGFKHLAFDVPDLDQAIEALKSDGVACDPIVPVASISPTCRVVFFRDLEGNIIELMEAYEDEI